MIYLLVIFEILACSCSQIFLKISAKRKYHSKVLELLNPWVIFSYGVFSFVLLINIWAMSKGVQLKEIAVLESLGYIFVPMFSFVFLKEKVSKRTILAMLLIMGGIFIFYM